MIKENKHDERGKPASPIKKTRNMKPLTAHLSPLQVRNEGPRNSPFRKKNILTPIIGNKKNRFGERKISNDDDDDDDDDDETRL